MLAETELAPRSRPDGPAAIVRSCVHCGFCTATCPTYVLLGDERDSPRGRIQLIKAMLGASDPPDEATVRHVDRCLSCLSCTTTCPSGVDYGALIDHARAHVEQNYRRPWHDRGLRALLAFLLPRPRAFEAALALGRGFGWIARFVPDSRFKALGMLAARAPRDNSLPLPAISRAATRQGQVILLTGCVQDAIGRGIHHATARLLNRMGFDVMAPPGATCCGAILQHMGRSEAALTRARALVDAWSPVLKAGTVDAVIVNASGCGVTVKELGDQLAHDSVYAERAMKISRLARDVSEFVAERGLPPVVWSHPPDVAYHPACSIKHGQKLGDVPHALLRQVGCAVSIPADSHLCCGSAGVYNILQPEIAGRLRDRKRAALAATGARIVATTNLGCMIQLGDPDLTMIHVVELLDHATGGPTPPSLPASTS